MGMALIVSTEKRKCKKKKYNKKKTLVGSYP